MSRPSSITLEDCQSLFYLPVAQAAAVLGVSRPTISKVLRAHGIKRWPYRKLRAEGKIESLRQHREAAIATPHPPVLPVLPALPPPPPLPPFLGNLDNDHQTTSHSNRHPQQPKGEPLFPQPLQATPDDETYILHLLDHPMSPRQTEDHTHPLLSLAPQPSWVCNEQLSEEHPEPKAQSPQSPSLPLPQHGDPDHDFHPDARSHTISTVRPAARAVVGAGNWSRGMFRQEGGHTAFTFLPTAPFGSSLSDEDPLNGNIGSEL